MRLNGDDIQDYIFPPFCFNKGFFMDAVVYIICIFIGVLGVYFAWDAIFGSSANNN